VENALTGRERLLRWFYTIVKLDNDLDVMVRSWMDADERCTRPDDTAGRTKCPWKLRRDSACRRQLRSFLEATTRLIGKRLSAFSTQLTESFHAMKAKFADNNFNWEVSWKARYCLALLDWNEGIGWKIEMYNELGFPSLGRHLVATFEKAKEGRNTRRQGRSSEKFKRDELCVRRLEVNQERE